MIDRFNFYDIYGYFIPGALLIAVLWLPHLIAAGKVPSAEISAALAMIVAAYIAGHVLQIVAAKALPSKVLFGGEYRTPSDLLLSEHPKAFSPEFQTKIVDAIRYRLGIDVAIRANRGQAFFLCRDTVIASKNASYVEQFEGMYVMMRGIAAAAAIGFAYVAGWLIAPFLEPRHVWVALVFFAAGAPVAWMHVEDKTRELRYALIVFVLGAVACAGILAFSNDALGKTAMLLAAAIASAAAAFLAFGSYREFIWTWAGSVYRHFYLIVRSPQKD